MLLVIRHSLSALARFPSLALGAMIIIVPGCGHVPSHESELLVAARDSAFESNIVISGAAPTAPGLQNVRLPPLLDRDVFVGDPAIDGATLSPDGQYIAFLQPHQGVMNIWIRGIAEPFEEAYPLTADTRPVRKYRWSADSRYVLYRQDRGGDENYQLYALDPTIAPGKVGVSPARDLTPADGVRTVLYAVPEATPGAIWVGLNDRDPAWHDLYRVDLATAERTLVYVNTDRITSFEFDHEGQPRLATRSAEDGSTEVLDFKDSAIGDVVYSCNAQETCRPVRFRENGQQVFMVTNAGNRDLTELVLFDPASGEETVVARDPEGEVDYGGTLFNGATGEIDATYYEGDRFRIYPTNEKMAADIDFLRAELPEGDIKPHSSTQDGRFWLVEVVKATDPGAVYLFDRDASTVELLYRSRPNLPSEHMADTQAIRYSARDGREISAYLTIPKGTSGQNLPALVVPHGGPDSRDFYGYNGHVQLLANRGYVVIQPNFRGSKGFGKAFLLAGHGEWGTGAMQHDLTDGVQWLVDQGIADPARIGILGASYGGYAALAGLAFTPDLYAAGISFVGYGNLITLLDSFPAYWASYIQFWYDRLGDPRTDEGRAELRARSPLFSADRIKAPLLLIHGANDPRVKQSESDQIVIALRDRGYPVQYMVAPDEGHGFRREINRRARAVVVERFLAEHLGGRMQTSVEQDLEVHLDRLMVDPGTVRQERR